MKKCKRILFLLFLILASFTKTLAQNNEIKVLPVNDSVQFSKQVDLRDIVHRFSKKTKHKRPTTKKFQTSVFPAIGYSSATHFAAVIAANSIFTLNGTNKESSILTSLTYSQFNQTIFPIQGSIWTKKDKFNIVIDYRYLNYPSSLFGLAGKSRINNSYTINFSGLKFHQTILTKVFNNLYAGIGVYFDYYWKISEVDVPVGVRTELQHYTKSKIPPSKEKAVGPAIKILYDSRDNPINSFKGLFASVVFHPSFKNWGSNDNWSSIVIDARKYFTLNKTQKKSLAIWAYYWANYGNPSPYLMLPSVGWDDNYNTGRGFQQGRYRGKSFLYLESEFRFQISQNGLFGGVLFANLQHFPNELYTSYSDYRGRKDVKLTSLGGGLGLRLKLNKYSKTNIAIDCGFGQSLNPIVAVNLGEVF